LSLSRREKRNRGLSSGYFVKYVWQLQLDPTFRDLVAHYRRRAWAVDIPETYVGWPEGAELSWAAVQLSVRGRDFNGAAPTTISLAADRQCPALPRTSHKPEQAHPAPPPCFRSRPSGAPRRLREFAQLSIIGAFVLLSPVLALLAAIAVEIAIDILLQAGGPPLPACVAAGAIGWMVLRRLRAPPRGRSSRNMSMRRCPRDAAQWDSAPYEAGTMRAFMLCHAP
jgi:hypothetical protein